MPILQTKDIKIALVHDFLTDFGGAERVLEVLSEMFPEAPIYTLLYDEEKMRGRFSGKDIRTSFLQKFPKFLRRRKKWLLPLLPVAPEIFDLRDFDLVLSSSGAWSKGIVTRVNTIHVAYIHSPMRFVWDANSEYLGQQTKSRSLGLCVRFIMNYLRIWDRMAADRPDFMIANSKYTQMRIKRYYGRDSEIIYPSMNLEPIPNDKISNVKTDKDHFLIVSRLSPYKKIDAVVEAFNKLGLPLVVIGEGQQERYLRSIAAENVKIMGYQPDERISELYAGARAFVFAGVDDFGLSPAEAMAHGVPVLAIRKGGALEIVEEGRTGEFFDAATPEVIADGVRRLIENEKNYDREYIASRAKRFDKERFKRELEEYINNIMQNI